MTLKTAEKAKDIFDEIDLDVFDEIDLDVFDDVDLPIEELVLMAIRKEIANLPIGKIIANVMQKEISKHRESTDTIKDVTDKKASEVKGLLADEVLRVREEIANLKKETTDKYDDFRNLLGANAQPWYQFGGFPANSGELPITDTVTGERWRLKIVDDKLLVQHFESNAWVEKAGFLQSA